MTRLRRKKHYIWKAAVLLIVCFLLSAQTVFALPQPDYINPETGYAVYIDDQAKLIVRDAVLEAMIPISAYGGVAFVSAYPSTASDVYAEERYREYFGTDSGTLFLIDMKNRYLWIYSDGAIYEVVTKAYANTITDNVYRDATAKDYTRCTVRVFEQIATLLDNGRIAQPMKHVSNVLLALLTGLALNFLLMVYVSRKTKPSREELAEAGGWHAAIFHANKTLKSEQKVYSPKNNESGSSRGSSGGGHSFGGGGGSRSFGGGGGGGGRSSGGGGGHRF